MKVFSMAEAANLSKKLAGYKKYSGPHTMHTHKHTLAAQNQFPLPHIKLGHYQPFVLHAIIPA